VDAAAWQAATDDLLAIIGDHMLAASVEGAGRIQDATRGLLTAQSHAAHTKTPSVAPEPPAMISGALAASVIVTPVPDELGADVGPTTDYGRIQEIGGWMQGHPLMHWIEDGIEHWSAGHSLPERPSLGPATGAVVDSGDLEQIYEDHVLEAIQEVTV